MTASALVEHFFRHEYGRLVSLLSCRVGMRYIEDVEDAVQSALETALEAWTIKGPPDNPEAWLYRVARNNLMGSLRQRSNRGWLLEKNEIDGIDNPDTIPEVFLEEEVSDDLLRTLFICADEVIPEESKIVLALKILCGFDIREIALRLFTSEATIYKRYSRARNRLRELSPNPSDLSAAQCATRVPSVSKILYLIFTEGHLSSHAEHAIRRELCDEAIRLATLLAKHPVGQTPETFALLALMHLHVARMGARQDASGGLLLLEEQDRTLWDRQRIRIGLEWLAKSAEGECFSRYHAEAGIAAEHCLADSFEETRWDRIAECYELLERFAPSPLHTLNRAVATAEWKGPAEGLAIIDGFEPPTWLEGSYLWSAVMADLHRRIGNADTALRFRKAALESAPTLAVKEILERRLEIED